MSIRKGNDIIASTPAVDAVPTQNSTNAVSSGGVYNALATKQDTISDLATIRAGAAAGATALQNTATATDALTVLGTSNTSWTNGINIGKDSRINSTNGVAIGVDASANVNAVGIGRDTDAGVRGTAIGAYAKTSADTGIAIGCWNSNTNNAVSSAKGAYQFGVGTNSTARTLNVGWYDDSVTPSTFRNYQLLDGNTGLIPDARISTNIARSTDIKDATITITQGGVTKGSFTLNQSSDDTIALDMGSDIDNSTITKNSDDEIQAVAVINQNAGGIVKTWKGTLAEYNLLGTYSNDTEYIVTDDETGGASVYTKAEVDNGFVALTGAQTVAGSKTFVDSIHYKETSITRGTAPNANKYSDINFIDTNGKWLAGFEHMVLTDKTSSFAMIVSDMVNDTGNVAGSIVLEQRSNGTVITGCPASGATANSILTNVACSIGGSGYVKFGNGLIIQWGGVQAEGWPNTKWVGLPTAFSTNDYSVVVTPVANGSNYTQTAYLPDPLYTTGFSVTSGINGTTPQSLWCRWIAIGY